MQVRQRPVVHLGQTDLKPVVSWNHVTSRRHSMGTAAKPRHRDGCSADRARPRRRRFAATVAAVTVSAYHTGSAAVRLQPCLDPARTVAELRELKELTGDGNTDAPAGGLDEHVAPRTGGGWRASSGVDCRAGFDAAGNQWWTLRGADERALVLGGHLDSVPNGWLDGALNVVAAAPVLRRIAEEGEPPLTVRLVSWADEEGARFGRSLFGSSAAAGSMADQDDLRALKDADGTSLPEAIGAFESTSTPLSTRARSSRTRPPTSSCTSSRVRCSSRGPPLGVVLGTFGVERHRIVWRGQAAHAGSTPMDSRRDALAGASRLALELRGIAGRAGGGAICTSGGVVCKPGIVTSVVETAEQLLDQRHLDSGGARRDVGGRTGVLAPLRRGGERRGGVREDLVDRADLFDETLISSPRRPSARSRAPRTGSRADRCTMLRKSRVQACRR